MQETAQAKMGKWTQGRVALLGDAGCCPSLISGMGTSLAIVGAYVLAGEIVKGGLNYEEAFQDSGEKMRPHVAKAQSLPPGAPDLANPQTKWKYQYSIALPLSFHGVDWRLCLESFQVRQWKTRLL
jgi:2-polyprenyl-6-methoxyphenol hydroxylase-like FAD-dependent oxidoreductase